MRWVKHLGERAMAGPLGPHITARHIRVIQLNRFTPLGYPEAVPAAGLRLGSCASPRFGLVDQSHPTSFPLPLTICYRNALILVSADALSSVRERDGKEKQGE